MAEKKQKAGWGARYGVRIRRRAIGSGPRRYPCPSCGTQRVKRVSAGIWSCERCGATFAGGAYAPTTTATTRTTSSYAQGERGPREMAAVEAKKEKDEQGIKEEESHEIKEEESNSEKTIEEKR